MKIFTFLASFLMIFSIASPAQKNPKDITGIITVKDSIFWSAYNSCNVEIMASLFTEDVEFYHDKGGVTKGIVTFKESLKKNLCSNENFKLRREVVPGSVKIYPMQNGDSIYGAIISGEHLFYHLEKGKPEKLGGIARFTHLWTIGNSVWQMSRVLSYDHGPAPAKL